MPSPFQIESVAIPLVATDYFTNPLSQYGSIPTATLVDRIAALGANDARLVVSLGQLDSYTDPTYSPFTTQSLESLRTFTDAAKARGIAITWMPTSNIANVIAGDPNQPSHIDPSDLDAWFASYRTAMLEQAQMAQAVGAARFSLLTDVEQPVFQLHPELTDRLVALIADIRQVFTGQITTLLYTPDGNLTSFPEAVLKAVDLIGLGLFPKLTNSTDPTLDQLKAALHSDVNGADIIGNLERLAESSGKPLWISDFAQSSYDGWLRGLPDKFDATATFQPDNTEQSLGYQAFFSEFAKLGAPWFEGFSVQNIGRIDDGRGLIAPYLVSPTGENFYGKPGQDMITTYYTGAFSPEANTVHATNYGEAIHGGYAYNVLYAAPASASITGGVLDDVIYGAGPVHGAVTHQLTLVVSGQTVNGTAPAFYVRVNGEAIPLNFSAPTPLGTGTTISIPVYASGAITSVEIVAANWLFAGVDANRFVQIESATLDGVSLTSLPSVYHISTGEIVPFAGGLNRGGGVTFDTSGASLTPGGATNLAANHTIDGGAGRDELIYAGAYGQYVLGHDASGGWTVQQPGAATGEGLDHLSNIEVLRFSDKAIWIGTDADLTDATGAMTVDMRSGATFQVSIAGQTVSVSAAQDLANATLGSGDDSVAGNALDNRIFGGAGADTIAGGGSDAAGDVLRGGDGNDSIVGGSGFDDINGNKGDDTISDSLGGDDWLVGGQGNDLISATTGGNILYGNLGNDTLHGGGATEIIRGGQGDDSLTAGGGADFISGDRGSDTVSGGAGADIFHSFGDAGVDRVLDFSVADGDRVQLDPGTQYTVAQAGADTVISMTGGAQMTLVGVQLSTLPPGWIFGA